MFRHCVMFRWKPEVTEIERSTIALGLDELAALLANKAYAHGPNVGLAEGNWDYVIVADFESRSDYEAYAADPGHIELIKGRISPNIEERAAVQYEIPGPLEA